MIPQEFPFALLVASGIWYVQQKAKTYMMARQVQFFSKPGYMNDFSSEHQFEFSSRNLYSILEDQGLPCEANGGPYFKKLNYGEWHKLSCARLAYNELVEKNPATIFQLLLGSLHFPWVAISAGFVYMLSSIKRVRLLFEPNGVVAARNSIFTKIKCASSLILKITCLASICKMIIDNYEINV